MPKVVAKACVVCRTRKIRCDATRPRCANCVSQGRECVYALEPPRPRPTFNMITELNRDVAHLQSFVTALKQANVAETRALLNDVIISDGRVSLPSLEFDRAATHPVSEADQRPNGSNPQKATTNMLTPLTCTPAEQERQHASAASGVHEASDEDPSLNEEPDLAVFASIDESGVPQSFGPSSALNQAPVRHSVRPTSQANGATHDIRNSLVAHAALQRQHEYRLYSLPNIGGVPTELAMHLLNLHWNRQHHTFLLTYRPAIMRDLANGGPHCSRFLLNAIFACSSKFSQRVEQLRDDSGECSTTGRHFLRRCDQLLAEDQLLMAPSLPTIVGLLLLGSTYVAKGETSKGWLYTGYALRMVFDLGLHLDPKEGNITPEEAEIRRRVFWGAFICDKLQSLYLGRPMTIDVRVAHVSSTFFDIFEEYESWTPYTDGTSQLPPFLHPPSPTFSISTFQQLCVLSTLMAKIISRFYVVGASSRDAKVHLEATDILLQTWQRQLPPELAFVSSRLKNVSTSELLPPPNVMNLHAIYHSLVVLLHRPFISNGHLRLMTAPETSWKRCTAAARSIADIGLAYRKAYSLQAAPYVLSYALYVACTIHVRNAAVLSEDRGEHESLLTSCLECLDDLCVANPGVTRPIAIIRNLMNVNGLGQQQSEFAIASPNFNSDLDFDAILAMFPVDSNVQGNMPQKNDAPDSFVPAYNNYTQHSGNNGNIRHIGDNMLMQNLDFFEYNDALFGPMGEISHSNSGQNGSYV